LAEGEELNHERIFIHRVHLDGKYGWRTPKEADSGAGTGFSSNSVELYNLLDDPGEIITWLNSQPDSSPS